MAMTSAAIITSVTISPTGTPPEETAALFAKKADTIKFIVYSCGFTEIPRTSRLSSSTTDGQADISSLAF